MPYIPSPTALEFNALFATAIATSDFNYRDAYGRNLLHLAASLLLIKEARELYEKSKEAGLRLADQEDSNHKLPSQYAKDAGYSLFAHAIHEPTEATWLAATAESGAATKRKVAAEAAYALMLEKLDGRGPGSHKGE